MKASISFSSSTNVVIVYIAIVSLLFKSSRWIFDFKLQKIETSKDHIGGAGGASWNGKNGRTL